MYQYQDLEQVLNKKFKIMKDQVLIYESDGYEDQNCYLINEHQVCCDMMDEATESLFELILDHNNNSIPFWHRALKGQSFDLSEVPKAYLNTQGMTPWLLKGHHVKDHLQLLEALFSSSQVTVLTSNQVIAFVLNEETISPEMLSQHYEAEMMESLDLIIGPCVDSVDYIHQAYESILMMEQHIKSRSIIKYEDVLLENLIGLIDLNDLSHLFDHYSKMYPVHDLTPELVDTIYSFFDYNLNITDTANALFLHRNTLIYRLNKIMAITSLDIRVFDQANKMKVLLIIMR